MNLYTNGTAAKFAVSLRFLSLFTLLWAAFAHVGFSQHSLNGYINDARTKESLFSVAVVLKESGKGTYTDVQGKFRLDGIAPGTYTLEVSLVGYTKLQTEIHIPDRSDIALSLTENTQLGGVEIIGQRYYPITKTDFSRRDIDKLNLGQDLPILLNFTPSVVTTSDAGAGIGYTGIRIRGSDPTRTNVTLNGIPLNDAESQGVFWVNMPDFASSVQNIQIQRGVGTSTNGAGAFGASMNITTESPSDSAYAETAHAYGSFHTWKHNARFGTGLIKNRFKVDGRLSRITSDGFIDRAFSNLKSFFVSAQYVGDKSSLTANVFSGKEVTYQAWEGVPEEILRKGNRTYNVYTYDNQVDDYQQDHYQLIYNLRPNTSWTINTALHYTKGRGFYEQFRENDRLSRYNLPNVVVGQTTISRSDLIRRRWLDNDFYGFTADVHYRSEALRGTQPVWDFVAGGAWNRYDGKHFGEVIWARFASTGNIRHRYYDNDGIKTDANVFAKLNWQMVENLFTFVDLQVRNVNYTFLGYDNELRNVTQNAALTFFNPKTGVRYTNGGHDAYFLVQRSEP